MNQLSDVTYSTVRKHEAMSLMNHLRRCPDTIDWGFLWEALDWFAGGWSTSEDHEDEALGVWSTKRKLWVFGRKFSSC